MSKPFDYKDLPYNQRIWYEIPEIIPAIMLNLYYISDYIKNFNLEAFLHATGATPVCNKLLAIAIESDDNKLLHDMTLEDSIYELFTEFYHNRMREHKGLDEINIDFYERFMVAYLAYSKFRLEKAEELVAEHYPSEYARYKLHKDRFDAEFKENPEVGISVLYESTAGFTALAMNLWNTYRDQLNLDKDEGAPINLYDHLVSHETDEVRGEDGYYRV